MAIVMVVLMKYIMLPIYAIIGVWLVSGIIIAIFVPVGDEHKPLDEIETKVYRRRALIVWAIKVLAGAALVIANHHHFAAYIAWAMAAARRDFGDVAQNLRENVVESAIFVENH
jgi:accessory gene regulator protein AgrB